MTDSNFEQSDATALARPAVVSQILAACGITKVIWIDDDFHLGALATTDIIERIRRNFMADSSLPQSVAALRQEVADDEEFFAVLSRRLDDDETLAKLVSRELVEASGEPGDGELTPEIRRKLTEDLGEGCTLFSYSHGDWLLAHEEHLREGAGVLYLVDNNYFKESLGENLGRQIISNQLFSESASHKAHCVLFTRSAESEGEAVPEQSTSGRTYLVLDKKNFKEGLQNSQIFANAVRRIINHIYVLEIAERTQAVHTENLRTGAERLKKLGIHALEELLFTRPDIEGASELETVSRLWSMMGQRTDVDADTLRRANIVRRIRALDTGSSFDQPAVVDPFVKELGEMQFFVSGNLINGQHCQLASGDIYEDRYAAAGQEKHGVLVWQPCDLALRSDGKRISSVGWYIPFTYVGHASEAIATRVEKLRSGKVFYLEMGKHSLGLIEFRLDKARMANLNLFDLASINKDGSMKVTTAIIVDELVLPGELLRYRKVIAEMASKINGSPPSLFLDRERTVTVDRKSTPKSMDCGLSRIKRLREPYAQEVLRAMCGMIARPGFEYTVADVRETPPTAVPTIATDVPDPSWPRP